MQDDCIAVALGLPQLKILEQKEADEYFEVTVIYRRKEAKCPRCGQVTNKEHDRRLQWKQDRGLRDKTVYLGLIKGRFRCLWCGKVFSEPDEIFGHRRRSTYRFREYLGQALAAPAPNAQSIQQLSGAIGNDSCLNCHLVHLPAQNAKDNWGNFKDLFK